MSRIEVLEINPSYSLYRIVSNIFQTNTYILVSGNEVLIVDPGFDKYNIKLVDEIVNLVREVNCNRAILYITHGHLDHFCGDLLLKNKLSSIGIKTLILIHERDSYLLSDLSEHVYIQNYVVPDYRLEVFSVEPHLPDLTVRDGDQIKVGSLIFKIIHCPGHTKGSTVLYCSNMLFTGDVILDGGIGRVDLPHSNPSEMKMSIYRILNMVNPDVKIFPGHGEPFYLREQLSLILTLVSEL